MKNRIQWGGISLASLAVAALASAEIKPVTVRDLVRSVNFWNLAVSTNGETSGGTTPGASWYMFHLNDQGRSVWVYLPSRPNPVWPNGTKVRVVGRFLEKKRIGLTTYQRVIDCSRIADRGESKKFGVTVLP